MLSKTDDFTKTHKHINKNILFNNNENITKKYIILQKLIKLLIKTHYFTKIINSLSKIDDSIKMLNSLSKTDDFIKNYKFS